MISKRITTFSIDIDLIEKFNKIIPNNEKSIFVERMIEKFVKDNPVKVRGVKRLLECPTRRGRYEWRIYK